MAATLVARDLSVSYGARVVLDRVEIVVAPGDRIGVLGPNGTGKSTLLRALAGLVDPDAGLVTRSPASATVGYLPQEPDRRAGETVLGLVARRTGVAEASADLDAATTALVVADPDDDAAVAGERYSTALERWLALGGDDLTPRAAQAWSDLGMPEALLSQETGTLSGGQAARAALAAVLVSRFDVLLLDEPTNDLDFDGLERLEGFVASRAEPLVVVSHDRAFLEATVTDVIDLDEHTHRAIRFAGGWAAYLDERATNRRHAGEAYAGYAAARRDLVERVRRQRQWSDTGARKLAKRPADSDKTRRGFLLNRTEKQAAKVRASERALERLEAVERPRDGWDLRLAIAAAPRSGAVTARLSGAVVERDGFRLGPIDLEIAWGERVAVLGPNGAGKSTLLEALLGRLPLSGGSQWLGPGVAVGEIDQSRALLASEGSLLAVFQAVSGQAMAREARSLLAKFGLGAGHVERAVGSLSPGERTRAVMALLMARGVNCLVLDEPTNHLDMAAIEQLELALSAFGGTLLLVTHDRALLDGVELDRVLRVEAGAVEEEWR